MRKSAVVAAVVAVAASLALTPSAQAASMNASCEANPGDHGVRGLVYYTAATTTQHHWSNTEFTLVGSSGTGGKSNMNIQLWVGSQKVAERSSLDNVAKNYTYRSTEHPRFYLGVLTNRSQSERVDFVGIFDTAGADPYCVARTATI